ncbi:hypothetical protein GCM10027057_21000 [Marisediminicola antarctica]
MRVWTLTSRELPTYVVFWLSKAAEVGDSWDRGDGAALFPASCPKVSVSRPLRRHKWATRGGVAAHFPRVAHLCRVLAL